MTRFSRDIVRLYDPNFSLVLATFHKLHWCVDGTHIPCAVSKEVKTSYIGRIGYPTQNILIMCDFDMLLTYFVAGWHGSVHDNRVLKNVVEHPNNASPQPLKGKYYVVDAGYPNMKRYLGPFKRERYNIPDFRPSIQPPIG
ncbi:unnamed protein product [Amaranthus hypochondriacus]